MQIFLEIYGNNKQNLAKDISLNNESKSLHQHLNKTAEDYAILYAQVYTVTIQLINVNNHRVSL